MALRVGGGCKIFTQTQFTRGGGAYGADHKAETVPLGPHTYCNNYLRPQNNPIISRSEALALVHNPPKQSQTQRLGNVRNFVRVVKRYLAKYLWTQKDLAVAADMSQSMISRMFRDQNGRGDTFDLTPEMVMKIACALEVGPKGICS